MGYSQRDIEQHNNFVLPLSSHLTEDEAVALVNKENQPFAGYKYKAVAETYVLAIGL